MNHGTGRTKRLIAGGAVGLVGLTFAPNVASAAISTTAFCASVPTGQSGFTDIANTAPHTRNIECLKGSGVTAGTTATTYSPTANVSRAQMATFIANMLDRAVALDAPGAPTLPSLPTAGASADAFTDDETSVHENNINRLKQAGIIAGTSATTFSPGDNVTRQQMASFIAQALAFIRGGALAEGADAFTDDETSVHEANINRLANADIVDGTSATTFNPAGLVSRAQMASFVVQAMADLAADGFITNLPSTGAQTFALPQTTEVKNAQAADASGVRTCTVTGLPSGASLDARVIATSDFVSATNTFLDPDSDNVFDQPPAGAIVNINGAPVGPAPQVNDIVVSPVGAVAITFAGGAVGVDASLLIWQDQAPDDDALALVTPAAANANPKIAAEPFGVGCRTLFVSNEAPIGAISAHSHIVDRDNDFILDVDDPFTYFYDANDVYQYQGVGITQAQFEGILSEDGVDNCYDIFDGAYNPDPAGVSTFNIDDDDVCEVVDAVPTVVNADGGVTINDVRLVVTPDPGNGPGTVFDFYADVNGNGVANAGELLLGNQTLTPGADGTVTLTFNNVPNMTSDSIIVVAKNAVSGVVNEFLTDPITVPGTPDAVAPLAVDSVVTNTGTLGGTVDTGEIIKIVFNEPMAAPSAGDLVRISDNDSGGAIGNTGDTIVDLVNGTNATFTLNAAAESVNGASRAANTVLTITVTATPSGAQVVQAGNIAGVALPATIIDQAGNTDVSAQGWSIAAPFQDLTLDLDAADTDDGITAPVIIAAVADESDDTVTLTLSEAVTGAPSAADFGYTDADNADTAPTTAVLGGGGTTITLTFADGVIEVADAGAQTANYDDESTAVDADDLLDVSGLQLADQTIGSALNA